MKFSELWLREWVNTTLDSEALSNQITMAGLEVDGVEPVAGAFNGVVVGEVVECGQHPNADKLRVTKVNVGGERLLDIVCGAPNCRQGLKVAVATVGAASAPGSFTEAGPKASKWMSATGTPQISASSAAAAARSAWPVTSAMRTSGWSAFISTACRTYLANVRAAASRRAGHRAPVGIDQCCRVAELMPERSRQITLRQKSAARQLRRH